MGFYIDPENCGKEEFLAQHGVRIEQISAKATLATGESMPVCLVDNGFFKAAGIGFSDHEIEHFSDERDQRPKQWFAVPREKLVNFYPDALKEIGERE